MGMLILNRQIGTRIMIGEDIVITILSVKGDGVRVGVEAPKDLPVHREEVYNRVKQAMEASDATTEPGN